MSQTAVKPPVEILRLHDFIFIEKHIKNNYGVIFAAMHQTKMSVEYDVSAGTFLQHDNI